MRRLFGCLVTLVFVFALTPAAWSQATELSDKDKKKLAEIAERPEVQAKIQQAWDDIRRHDIEFAYNVNTATRFTSMSRAEFVELRSKYGELYDNPALVQYVNSLGQSMVPKDSPNLFAFRLLLDPVPRAEALSTGTIYVSTGLVAALDNEAQLAYVLAHEMAHVERQHHYNALRKTILEEELATAKEADAQKKKAIFGLAAGVAGGLIGGGIGGSGGAFTGAMTGAIGGAVAGHFLFRNKFQPTDWDTANEDEADEVALKYMLERNYDPREIPRLYAQLDRMVGRDSRIGLGFIGNPTRVKERTAQMQSLLNGAYKAELETKMKAGLRGSSGNFALLMSALKRDNGIVALDYDLFAVAKDNLEEAARLRSDDPRVYYNLGRLMMLTGRSPEEKQQAIGNFLKAIQYDAQRGEYPDPHLEYALHLMSTDPTAHDQIKKELKTFISLYQRAHGGQVPPNMYVVYDYLQLAGDSTWFAPPTVAVSTRYVEPLQTTQTAPEPPEWMRSTSTVTNVKPK